VGRKISNCLSILTSADLKCWFLAFRGMAIIGLLPGILSSHHWRLDIHRHEADR